MIRLERLQKKNTYRQHSVQWFDQHQDSYFEGWIALFQPLINLYSYPYCHWHLYLIHHQLGHLEVRLIPDHYVIHLLRRLDYYHLESLHYQSSGFRRSWRYLVYHSCRELHQFEHHLHCHFSDYFRLSFNQTLYFLVSLE